MGSDKHEGATDDGWGVLAVDDYWIVVLPDKSAGFATREEAYAWMVEAQRG